MWVSKGLLVLYSVALLSIVQFCQQPAAAYDDPIPCSTNELSCRTPVRDSLEYSCMPIEDCSQLYYTCDNVLVCGKHIETSCEYGEVNMLGLTRVGTVIMQRLCYCPKGQVVVDNRNCTEFLPCEESWKDRYCEQMCESDKGIAKCRCAEGFHAQIEKHGGYRHPFNFTRCVLTDATEEELRLVLVIDGRNASDLWQPAADQVIRKSLQLDISAGSVMNGLDFATNVIYSIKTNQSGNISLGKWSLTGSSTDSIIPKFKLTATTRFAKDFETGNFYYVDSARKLFFVCTADGLHCKTMLDEKKLKHPAQIVIDQQSRYILIADWDYKDSILWGFNISSNKVLRTPIAGVPRMQYITLDPHNKQIYFYNQINKFIYKYDYLRKTAPENFIKKDNVSSMDMLGSDLLVAVYNSTHQTTKILNITTNRVYRRAESVLTSGRGIVKDLMVYSSTRKSFVTVKDHNCSHMYIGNSCACEDGYQLEKNGTCTKLSLDNVSQPVLLYTMWSQQMIKAVKFNTSLCNETYKEKPMPTIATPGSPTDVVYHYNTNTVYFSDGTSIWKQAANASSPTNTGIQGMSIGGMSIDEKTSTLFYTDVQIGSIQAVSLKNYSVTRIIKSPAKEQQWGPKSITVHSDSGRLYWVMSPVIQQPALNSSIWTSYTNGDEMEMLLTDINPAASLLVDDSDLYWTDFFTSTLRSHTLNRNLTETNPAFQHNASLPGINLPYALAKFDHMLYFSSYVTGELFSFNLSGHDPMSAVQECLQLPLAHGHMFLVDKSQARSVDANCTSCSGICLRSATGFVCECVGTDCNSTKCAGGVLCKDHNKCAREAGFCDPDCVGNKCSACKQDEYRCYSGNPKLRCIASIKVCDGNEDCAEGEDEGECAGSSSSHCPSNKPFSCGSDGECISQSWVCDGYNDCSAGEDELNCESCPSYMYECIQGHCINLEMVCDGRMDCINGKDEVYCQECDLTTQMRCNKSGLCLSLEFKCDGNKDCDDASDELNCTSDVFCGGNEHTCPTGQCIPKTYICDGENDCGDNSDEKKCDKKQCLDSQFMCNNTGKCIPREWECDMQADCSDGEDEWACELHCLQDQFKCLGTLNVTQCIDIFKVCDGHSDCSDDTDEINCGTGACKNAACSHDCVPDQHNAYGYRCVCPAHMTLDWSMGEGFVCIPKPACEEWGACSQVCKLSFQGIKKCRCYENYTLEEDLFSCKHDDGAAQLIFSNRHDLRLLSTEPSEAYSVIMFGLRNTIAVDFHYVKNYIFWTDVIEDKIYRGSRQPGDGGILTDIVAVVTDGLPTAEGLAVDWIGDHIYWVESGLDIIEVADLDGKNRKTIISASEDHPMENPRAIAVDPRYGYLFWADWGIKKIQRATLSGDDITALFRVDDHRLIPGGGWANGLTLDYDSQRVYWIDAKSDSIHTIKYDGTEFHKVLEYSPFLEHPFSISIFGNWVYWSDWRTNSINRANKWNGTLAQEVQATSTQPFDLKVFHPGRQPSLSGVNFCKDNGGCSHLCLRNSEDTGKCACPHLTYLREDEKTCANVSEVLLLASSHISGRNLTSYENIMPTLHSSAVDTPYLLDYITVNEAHKVIWADKGRLGIFMADLIDSEPRLIIDMPYGVGYGFAVDWVHRNFYFLSYTLRGGTSGKIEVMALDGSRRKQITTGFVRPTRIALLPYRGLMFVVDEDKSTSYVYKLYMNGSFVGDTKESSRISTPAPLNDTNISLDQSSNGTWYLYYGNSSLVYKYDLDTEISTVVLNNRSSKLWTVYRGSILFCIMGSVTAPSFTINQFNLTSGVNSSAVIKDAFPQDIKVLHERNALYLSHIPPGTENPPKSFCAATQCAHLCLPGPDDTGSCVCAQGFVPDDDALFKCRNVEQLIMYSSAPPEQSIMAFHPMDMNESMISIPQIVKAGAIEFDSTNEFNGYIYWVDSGRSINRIRRDLSGRETIASGLSNVKDMSIDWIAGNLYWCDSSRYAIEVSKLNGTGRIVLLWKNITKPISIGVHPGLGYLFWMEDLGEESRIRRSFLSGDGRMDIITSGLPHPVGLAVDIADNTSRVYFVGSSDGVIEVMDADGGNRAMFEPTSHYCSALTVGNSYVFWAETARPGYNIYWKHVGNKEEKTLIKNTKSTMITDLSFYDSHRSPNQQEPAASDVCAEDITNCEGLCLYDGKVMSDTLCHCAFGKLSKNGRRCEDHDSFLVYSKVDAIKFLFTDGYRNKSRNPVVDKPNPDIKNSTYVVNVIAVAIDNDRNRVIYSDMHRRAITSVSFKGQGFTSILENVASVEGLAYDSGSIFFTSQSPPSINRVNLQQKTYARQQLLALQSSDAPRAIVVNSCEKYIYWTNWNEFRPSVQRAYEYGHGLESIITTKIVIPNGLAIDYAEQKLYWADANLDKIERCNLDGTNRQVFLQKVSPHIFAIAVHGDFIYWSDWRHRAIQRAHKIDGSFNQTLIARLDRQPMGIAIKTDVTCKHNPCYNATRNGTCSQLCSLDQNKRIKCACHPYYQLSGVGTCKLRTDCEGRFSCGSTCIDWALTCDGVNNCDTQPVNNRTEDENPEFCQFRQCPRDRYFTCRNHHCVSKHLQCNGLNDCGDFSDELNCTVDTQCDELADQFVCSTGNQCIPKTQYCDGIPQCSDRSDEICSRVVNCTRFKHPFYGVYYNGTKCPNTPVCIVKEMICDGINDCYDDWDEDNCDEPDKCAPGEFDCGDTHSLGSSCIPRDWICDNDFDCPDHRDEKNCTRIACDGFLCQQGDLCLDISKKCDGKSDCFDGSDELNCASNVTCKSSQFACANGKRCIPLGYICDEDNDCDDHSDELPETGCPLVNCGPGLSRCDNNRCIDASFVCDRFNDCGDNSDEPDSCSYPLCDMSTEFTCNNASFCVPLADRCNGWQDCPDGSDELSTSCPPERKSFCKKGKWQCPSTSVCIDNSKLCDRVPDCADQADEIGCGLNECFELNGGCSQICVDDTVGFHCDCYHGYEPSKFDQRICVDINECAEKMPCSQTCINTQSSFHCVCAQNYSLGPDKRVCKATHGLAAYLLVANRYYIRNVTIRSSNTSQHLISQTLTNAVGLDYDWKEQMIYVSDVSKEKHEISRYYMKNGTKERVLHSVLIKHPDGVAVDWIGRNLYWCDNILNTIEVSKLNGTMHKVLLTHIAEPRALQLLPSHGYLFYSDWSQSAHIGRANMDGSNLKNIVNSSIGWPNALAVDPYTDTLFFGDAKFNYIAMTDLDGNNRKMILTRGINHIFAMTVYENYLYWSNWGNKTVMRADKFTGENVTVTLQLVHRPMELKVVHELNQVSPKLDPCSDLNCAGLCLLRPGSDGAVSGVCACPQGHELMPDGECRPDCYWTNFKCTSSLQCIHRIQLCDNYTDCDDGSDEKNCGVQTYCEKPFMHECAGTNQCIEAEKMCDGTIDCPQREDEIGFDRCQMYDCLPHMIKCNNGTHHMCLDGIDACKSTYNCSNRPDFCHSQPDGCLPNEFQCSSGSCIGYMFRCDNSTDCVDGSDESNETCSQDCKKGFVACRTLGNVTSSKCIPLSWKCDAEDDCPGGVDEGSQCSNTTCEESYYKCADSLRCIPQRWVCDYELDCDDGSDEKDCVPRQCTESEFMCAYDKKCVHNSVKCNGVADCVDSSDELGCSRRQCKEGIEFQCKDKENCIPISWKCDNTADCADQSDEMGCQGRVCGAQQFQCNNSICITSSFVCDGQSDCLDSSDEEAELCDNAVCLPDRFRCSNNKCVLTSMLCNGNNDCGDNSDENQKYCKMCAFTCANGACVEKDKICDGKVDCPVTGPENSKRLLCQLLPDKKNCSKDLLPLEENDETNQQFTCRKMTAGCTSFNSAMHFMRNLLKRMKARCGPVPRCESNPKAQGMAKLSCIDGYQVNMHSTSDYCTMCTDKNECLEFGRCSQQCENKPGAYKCSCMPGFTSRRNLSNFKMFDGECVLGDDEKSPYLLVAEGNLLRSVDLNKTDDRVSFLTFTNSTSRIDSIAVDTSRDSSQAVVYMLSFHTKEIMRANVTSSLQYNTRRRRRDNVAWTATKSQSLSMAEPIKRNLGDPRSITFDWINQNLYWTDASSISIHLMNVNGSNVKETVIVTVRSMRDKLKDNHESPQGITVDPIYSKRIFWTDWGFRPRIWTASLDGSEPKVLYDDVQWPVDITCDVSNQRLYWTDGKRRTIETINVYGTHQHIVYKMSDLNARPSMIDVFGRELFVTYMDKSKVISIWKFYRPGIATTKHANHHLKNGTANSLVSGPLTSVGAIAMVHSRRLPLQKDLMHCNCSADTITTTRRLSSGKEECVCLCQTFWKPVNNTHCKYCPCLNNGTCGINKPIPCLCPPGYGGDYCQNNMCEGYCRGGGECEIYKDKLYCKCKNHRRGDRCEISKCDDLKCKNGGTCDIDDGGIPYCKCKPGFSGHRCEDGSSSRCDICRNKASCLDTSPRPTCKCKAGYTGVNCQLCNETLSKNAPVCAQDAGHCSLSPSPHCVCHYPNFDPSTLCHHSYCYQHCENGGVCSIENGTKPHCKCNPNFSGDRCQFRTKCVLGYCRNGGTCTENVDPLSQQVSCSCVRDFGGHYCEKKCEPGCAMNFQCVHDYKTNSSHCGCAAGLRGSKCDIPRKCDSHCHGGKCEGCSMEGNDLPSLDCDSCCKCSCPDGWAGERCETRQKTTSQRPTTSSSGIVIACVSVGVILLAVLIVTILYCKRKRRRELLFTQLRDTEYRDGSFHVANPMYMKSMSEGDVVVEDEDEDLNTYSGTTTNFTNPFHLLGANKKKNKEEKSALLINSDDEDEADS